MFTVFCFVFCYVFFCSLSLVGPGHVLIAAYDERTCSQLRDVSTTSHTEHYFVPDNLITDHRRGFVLLGFQSEKKGCTSIMLALH